MTRRALQAAALCATLTLTACTGSPQAAQPNTTPPPTTPTTTAAPSTPTWTEEEQAAITAAKSRYAISRAAIDKALADPTKSSRAALEAAGLGDSWLLTAIEDVRSNREDGWYTSGTVNIVSLSPLSVNLDAQQPEVRLKSCIDSSQAVLRFQSNGKPVPLGPGNGKRHAFQAKVVQAPAAGKTTKMWFVVEEKTIGPC
ncbi:hypothetical protein [Kribbella sp. NPDC006257]|uniref:hypothetical protein n=1 Tax=Kribbella sp. NPDC006257 TaxID=3156738 RepID=UPI0033AF55BA